jgi:hypothetical protein
MSDVDVIVEGSVAACSLDFNYGLAVAVSGTMLIT